MFQERYECALLAVLLFVALCFAFSTEVLLQVLERIFVMALLCHFRVILVALSVLFVAIWVLALPLLFTFVKDN
jgi:hypothetical protein